MLSLDGGAMVAEEVSSDTSLWVLGPRPHSVVSYILSHLEQIRDGLLGITLCDYETCYNTRLVTRLSRLLRHVDI